VVGLDGLSRRSLAVAGGKAANLGEMLTAGLPVPPGFCVTTDAYARVAAGAGLDGTVRALDTTAEDDTTALARIAAQARTSLLAAPVPPDVAREVAAAYRALSPSPDGPTPVAVRSSATAEDLPGASFAGQQETYLTVVVEAAVLDAVRRCWASLWTDRAVAYRASNSVEQRSVRLAVVVQRMVDAAVAGVMFTANPLTGRRGQAVIDASPGLGEAVVSGAVNPDHFVVDVASGRIVERQLGDKRVRVESVAGGGTQRVERVDVAFETGAAPGPCLTDDQVRALAALARRVEAHYRAPQDTEWALDAAGRLWLTQSRPITTLHPLPENAPPPNGDLRVYFSFNVAQGVFRPLTPMGIQAFRLISAGVAGLFGAPPLDPVDGSPVLATAAGRLFLDVTPVVRTTIGRALARRALAAMETRSAAIAKELFADPRLAPRPASAWHMLRHFVLLALGLRLPQRVLKAILAPPAARRDLARVAASVLALGDVAPDATSAGRIAALERLLLQGPPRVIPVAVSAFGPGVAAFSVAERLLGDAATPDERDAMRRALPHNPTTEMDLALWDLAERIRADAAAADAVRRRPAEDLGAAYAAGTLPPTLQHGLAAFLRQYGHRGVAEIDLGVPRWGDDPAPILGVLANYLRLESAAQSPAAQFRAAAQRAETLLPELDRRAGRIAWWRGIAVRLCYRYARQMAGLREAPKYHIVAMLAKARALLQPVAADLAQAGRLSEAGDVYFLTLPEVKAALAGADVRDLVRERRAEYERELRRRHLPRILLSDGTEPTGGATAVASDPDGVLRGAPASAGQVTGRARVILDPNGAHLEPGEILVAPSTDPGWTPLFLTAGGLVMEMGGAMSHGAVVAREYGIPAVVGVPGATERIKTGQTLTVDGAAGLVAAG
jgi:pyruvate,water dikinase